MTAKLAAALVAAQKEMPKVEKDAVNPHFKSRFTSLDHLIAKTRPVLAKHGLAIVQQPTGIPHYPIGDKDLPAAPGLKTTLIHESGEVMESTMPLLIAGNDMQKLGAALTFAKRYAWAALLGISEQDDDDGNAASAPSKPAAAHPAAGPDPKAGAAGEEPPAPASPSQFTAPDLTPPDAELKAAFAKALNDWKVVKPEYDVAKALAGAEGKDAAWVRRQIARINENLKTAAAA